MTGTVSQTGTATWRVTVFHGDAAVGVNGATMEGAPIMAVLSPSAMMMANFGFVPALPLA